MFPMPLMEGSVILTRVRANTNREEEPMKGQRTRPSFRSVRSKKDKADQVAEAVADIRQWRRDHVKFPSSSGDIKKKVEERLDLFHHRIQASNARREMRASTSSSEKEIPGSPRIKVHTGDWRPKLSEKGKEVVRSLTWPVVKDGLKPRQKDPLHQWMVEHSGGTIRSN
ncbi:hypothetical protein F4774DRAFT_428314 [Daldinia eschscholtzii]|nr:hypothetical protein F4774DRAFT_428314 [Daldinia eschscholtzii]